MTALLSDTGCCPVCGLDVPRLLSRAQGVATELYACPRHGPIEYGPRPVRLGQWIDQFRNQRPPPAVAHLFTAPPPEIVTTRE